MPWWLMPAITFGVTAYVKGRTKEEKGKVRWLNMTQAEMMAYPLGILATKFETGDALPAPPKGYRWKLVKMLMTTNIFATPSEATFYIKENGLQIGQTNALSNFLTQPQAYGHHPAPPEVIAVAPFEWAGQIGVGSSYLTHQEAQGSVRLDNIAGLSGAEDEAMRALNSAIEQMLPVARQHGMVIARIAPELVRAGDLIVLRDG